MGYEKEKELKKAVVEYALGSVEVEFRELRKEWDYTPIKSIVNVFAVKAGEDHLSIVTRFTVEDNNLELDRNRMKFYSQEAYAGGTISQDAALLEGVIRCISDWYNQDHCFFTLFGLRAIYDVHKEFNLSLANPLVIRGIESYVECVNERNSVTRKLSLIGDTINSVLGKEDGGGRSIL